MIHTLALRYQYPAAEQALAFPDLALSQGATLLVTGPAGCGKSTWLALLAAHLRPRAGMITVAGQALHSLSSAAAAAWRARSVGWLPQRLQFDAKHSVQDHVTQAFEEAQLPQDLARTYAALQSMGVADYANRTCAQLSKAQARRVALARALLLCPALLLVDAPTTDLNDQDATETIRLLMNHAYNHTATLVLASPDPRVAQYLSAQATQGAGFRRIELPAPAAATPPAA